jgi:hypothetical protein
MIIKNSSKVFSNKASTNNQYSVSANAIGKLFDSGGNGSTSQALINSTINGTGKKFTLSFWIQRRRTTTTLAIEGLFSNAVSAAENQVIIYINAAQQLLISFGGGASGVSESYLSSSTFTDTFQWTNIIITYDQTRSGGSIKLYKNGILDIPSSTAASGGFTSIYSSTRNYYFGYYPPSGTSTTAFINKKSICLWNVELTASEIWTLWNDGFYFNPTINSGNYISATNLKLYFDFGNAVWSTFFTVTDASGNNNGIMVSSGHALLDYLPIAPSIKSNSSRIINTVSSSYLTEASNLFARFTTQPSNARKAIINETIFQLKNSGIWNVLDAIYFFAASDEQSALLNWKSSSFNCTKAGTPIYTADRGFTGASGNYLTTNFAPSTQATNFVSAGASWGFYSLSGGSGTDVDMGVNNTTHFLRNNGTLTSRFYSSQSAVSVASSPSTGFNSAVRYNAVTLINLFKNGGSIATGSAALTGAPAGNIEILRSGTGTSSTKQIAFAFMGGSTINQLVLHQIVQWYLRQIAAI